VEGKVVRIVTSGAFIRLDEVDAFIPISEMAERRIQKVADVLEVGQSVEALVTEIRADERRMILSLRRLARERERTRVKDYITAQADEGRVTIGDIAGELLRQVVTTPAVAVPDRPRDGATPPADTPARPAQDEHTTTGGPPD